MLLAWDTSTDEVTLALVDGAAVLGRRAGRGARRHAEALVPLLAELLSDAGIAGPELDALVVGVGPGAYTGLRVGLVTAQALEWTWGVPAVGACSLDAVAVRAVTEHAAACSAGVRVVTDAKRGQVFTATYDGSGQRQSGPTVGDPAAICSTDVPVVGSAVLRHREVCTSTLPEHSHADPDASWLARGVAGGLIERRDLTPLYLRQPDVTVGAGPKPVLQPGWAR
jgi:tRNA threonylcarbamoyl adenosine modification protein YeaZ